MTTTKCDGCGQAGRPRLYMMASLEMFMFKQAGKVVLPSGDLCDQCELKMLDALKTFFEGRKMHCETKDQAAITDPRKGI